MYLVSMILVFFVWTKMYLNRIYNLYICWRLQVPPLPASAHVGLSSVIAETACVTIRSVIAVYRCKGVRFPPIFSLSNLIAGTNRNAYLLHASFALKDSRCQWSSNIVLLWSNNWCLNIYILMNCHNEHQLKAILTNEDKKRLVTWPCWEIDYTVESVETTIKW